MIPATPPLPQPTIAIPSTEKSHPRDTQTFSFTEAQQSIETTRFRLFDFSRCDQPKIEGDLVKGTVLVEVYIKGLFGDCLFVSLFVCFFVWWQKISCFFFLSMWGCSLFASLYKSLMLQTDRPGKNQHQQSVHHLPCQEPPPRRHDIFSMHVPSVPRCTSPRFLYSYQPITIIYDPSHRE